ncbi:DNA damage-regulated autophagy modulator protein 1-like isoform X2 [Dendropsophus ebraccatus]|uniref:DNA damage-regulated autophagy modulator protein 1-like isoform X2 n=1 Tax=Dendropsophus ebraccatus TaxID=150705 RepID=UPI0038319E2C
MEIRGLGFIPLLLVFWCVAWLSASYTVTIVIGHKPALMYISGAGKVYPDNILFPIGFIGSSIAKSFGARPAAVQRVLLAVTWISCIGTMVMAAFPICTSIFMVAEWLALMCLLINVLTCCEYCQRLCLKISCKNTTISLREKKQDQV